VFTARYELNFSLKLGLILVFKGINLGRTFLPNIFWSSGLFNELDRIYLHLEVVV
jgi:hypothetical protein